MNPYLLAVATLKLLFNQNLGKSSRFDRGARQGFSLVESVLALAIVGFASTVILGLLPVGMTAFHNSITETVQSQIIKSLTTQASQSDFSNLKTWSTNFYFDDEGQPVASAAKAIYTAQVTQVAPSIGGVSQSTNLNTIKVEIYTTHGAAPNPNDPTKFTYAIRIANLGQ